MCRVGRGVAVPMVPPRVFLVSARGGSGPGGVSQTPHERAAEGTEDLVHKGRVCGLGFRLSADGGLQLPAQRQRPDLVDRKDGAQAGRCGGLCRSLMLGDGLQLLLAVQVEPPRRCPVPGVRPAALRPSPEAVEGMAWVPGAGCPRHDGSQGVWGLVARQGGGAVWQGCARQDHGVYGFEAPVALLRVWGDPHLVLVATFQHNHGDVAGVTFAWWGPCACRCRSWWVPLHHAREVAPRVAGCPAFPFRQVFVRWDVEGACPRLRGGLFPAPGAGRGPGVCRWRYQRVCRAQVWNPYASLVWLVGVEPPDPRVKKVVRDLRPGGDERPELPHTDVGCCGVRQRDYGKEPVRVDVLEVFPEGCHQPARGCGGVDVVDRPQFRVVKGVRVPPLWWPGGWGGAWSPGPGPVWCQLGRGALWCQGVPQARFSWRAPVAGAWNRMRRWAVSHRISEVRRSL